MNQYILFVIILKKIKKIKEVKYYNPFIHSFTILSTPSINPPREWNLGFKKGGVQSLEWRHRSTFLEHKNGKTVKWIPYVLWFAVTLQGINILMICRKGRFPSLKKDTKALSNSLKDRFLKEPLRGVPFLWVLSFLYLIVLEILYPPSKHKKNCSYCVGGGGGLVVVWWCGGVVLWGVFIYEIF